MEVDPDISPDNIKKIEPRKGSTVRSANDSLEKTGEIIADIVITLQNGDKRFISVKDKNGATVANFGVADLFNDDLTVNDKSSKWEDIMFPLGLDSYRIQQGLEQYRDQTVGDFDSIDFVSEKLTKKSEIYKLLKSFWGAGYIYLRKKSSGFEAMEVTSEFLDSDLLKNLEITEIRYPDRNRKQVTVILQSDKKKYKIELRNTKGKIKPTELKFVIV
jgi:hypothetical protein